MSEQPRRGSDPWRSFRGVMAGTLILESIVMVLALPVVVRAQDGFTATGGGYVLALTVAFLLLAGVQGRSWAIWVNIAMQFVVIAGVMVHGAIGFVGVLFLAVWLFIAYLRAEVKRREARGELPGQQSAED
ncbi:DUF4233 domain-containing protein [Mycolicibacterium thermoresistibile]